MFSVVFYRPFCGVFSIALYVLRSLSSGNPLASGNPLVSSNFSLYGYFINILQMPILVSDLFSGKCCHYVQELFVISI